MDFKNFDFDDLAIAKNKKWSKVTNYAIFSCGFVLLCMGVVTVVNKLRSRKEQVIEAVEAVAGEEETPVNG